MKLLKERILQDGKCLPGGVLKVDSFINHQMDPLLMMQLAEEFVLRFSNVKIDKIITIEASGIAPAIFVGHLLKLPVVFAKKKQPKTMDKMLITTVHSFTKDRNYTLCLSQEFILPNEQLLFIDDFLANGNAANGIVDIAEQAGAQIIGMGFIIEKAFQRGGDLLREKNIQIESLAIIESLDNCTITFKK